MWNQIKFALFHKKLEEQQKVNGEVRVPLIQRPARPIEKSTLEQIKEQIELAESFDALQRMPAWEKVVKYLGTEVQAELIESTKFKYEPVRQAVHVTRWDAKRELLDGLLGYIEATQAERDRIIAEYKERNFNEYNGTSGN